MPELLAPPAAVNPRLLLAEVLLWLHQKGVHTGPTTGLAADAAAAQLLRSVGVAPVAGPLLTQYRVELVAVRRSVLAADEPAAEMMARAWTALPRTAAGRTAVLVRPIGARLPEALR